ncbi:MAG: fatty acid desaturase, partial [Acidobacteria bacterium]|nr:fatty acid desaturase [Acidobacteriota bacterium]
MSGANASPVGRSHQEMSGANASPVGRSHQEMSGANASPVGRSHREMTHAATISLNRAVAVNRITTAGAVSLALGSYFWQPTLIIHYVLDIALRAYMHFVAGSMAHESVHGHLGNSRWANLWWGRIAMLPTTVPFVIFRKTHLRHHAATNIPEKDPDEFLNTPRAWEIPLRAWLLPYHWVTWLMRNGQFTAYDRIEYALT